MKAQHKAMLAFPKLISDEDEDLLFSPNCKSCGTRESKHGKGANMVVYMKSVRAVFLCVYKDI